MNREIKFRVWDRDYKMMHIVGDFNHDSLKIDEDNNIYYLNLQCMEASPHKGIDPENCTYRLMQYTGLKDKNGKEVYEGDIIQFVWGEDSCWGKAGTYKGYITFGKSEFEVEYIDREEKIMHCDKDGLHEKNKTDNAGALFSWSDEVEVIGNIYDNPIQYEEQ